MARADLLLLTLSPKWKCCSQRIKRKKHIPGAGWRHLPAARPALYLCLWRLGDVLLFSCKHIKMLIVLRKQAFLQTREQRMEQESQDNWVHIDGRRKNKVQSYKPLQKIITKLVAVFCLLFFVRGCGQYSLSLSNHLILKSRKVFSPLSPTATCSEPHKPWRGCHPRFLVPLPGVRTLGPPSQSRE